MKYTTEQQLIGSRQDNNKGNTAFINRTMQRVKANSGHNVFATTLRRGTSTRQRLATYFKRLPVAAAIAIIIAAVVITGGCVYAAVHFVPSLIKITGKQTSQRGTTEYVIPNFADCTHSTTKKFELNKNAPLLSDEDVQKIVQARCELDWANQFVSQTWPTYGSHKQWKEGDDIFYARPDMLGTLQSASQTKLTIVVNDNTPRTYASAGRQSIVAYANGEKIPLSNLKPNDTIFAVVRVAETYHDKTSIYNDGSIRYYKNDSPRTIGVIAALKLSLPAKYYVDMQQFITEIPPCDGNPQEFCPHTGFVDVFPREGGEAAHNSAYVDRPGNVLRTISGQVTELSKGSLSLKSSSGAIYTATATNNAFEDYNQHYAPNYKEFNATLQLGSTVFITYSQPRDADPKKISLGQIFSIGLQIDASKPKLGTVKQY